jgi:hypothetical protein
MAYIKPSWFFARVFNRVVLATGAVSNQPLTVIKRGSKLPQTIPMTPVDLDGVKYLVSVRGCRPKAICQSRVREDVARVYG